MEATPELPSDIDSLQALVLKQRERIGYLEHDNRILYKIAFGRKTEKRRVQFVGEAQGGLFAQCRARLYGRRFPRLMLA